MTSAVEASLKKKAVSQVVVLGETRCPFWVRGVSTNDELAGVAVEEWRVVVVRGLFLGMPAVGIISGKWIDLEGKEMEKIINYVFGRDENGSTQCGH